MVGGGATPAVAIRRHLALAVQASHGKAGTVGPRAREHAWTEVGAWRCGPAVGLAVRACALGPVWGAGADGLGLRDWGCASLASSGAGALPPLCPRPGSCVKPGLHTMASPTVVIN